MWVENRQIVIVSSRMGSVIKLRKICVTLNRLLHTSCLVFAMTDHFFGGEGGEKEADVDSAITENGCMPPSLHPHKINCIPSLRGGTTKQSIDF